MLPLRDLVRVVWGRLWVILLVVCLTVGVAVGYSLVQTPKYEASVKMLVGQKERTGDASSLGSDVQGLQQFTQTLTAAVSNRPLVQTVIDQLNLRTSPEAFLANLSAQQIPETQFIQITYEDSDPKRAQLVVNTVGDVFSRRISEVSPDASAITATVWEPAAVPDAPKSPDLMLNLLLALGLGVVLGLGLVFLLEYLDDSWRSPEEAEQVTGIPTFGVVPNLPVPQQGRKGGW